MDLLFERFLSEERGEWPDIDLDLPSGDKREQAIQYVYQRFGKLGAAMTANVITYRGRSAAREVGKALGFEVTSLEKLGSLAHAWEFKDPKDTTERQFHEAGFDLNHPRVSKFCQLYRMAQDLPRHLGQHSGGMVVCQGALDSVVPLEPATMPARAPWAHPPRAGWSGGPASIRSALGTPPPCPAASSSSGIKRIAPISAS